MDPPLGLDDLRLLAALASATGVRGAATRLGIPRTTVSRRIGELERRLGDELFLRRGRALVATSFGELLTERAEVALAAWDDVALVAESGADARERRLTIATSPLFAELVLGPVLEELARRRPSLAVELRLSHDYVEIFDDRVDVALRRGPLTGSADSLARRKLGRTTLVSVATPELAATRGALDAATWAERAPWIRVSARLEPFTLALSRSGRRARGEVRLTPRFAVDSQRIALDLAMRGLGIARVNEFLARDALAAGTVVEVLPEGRSSEDTFALYARRPRTKPIVKELLDLLVARTAKLDIFDR